MDITKKFATFDEQLEIIENKGFEISNREECLNFLKSVNYYEISAYFLPFRNSTILSKNVRNLREFIKFMSLIEK